MSNIQVQYMGLQLANPLVAASSGITGTPEKIAACEDAGMGGVVVKSLFQEEIEHKIHQMDSSSHPEGHDYIAALQTGFDLEQYCGLIRAAKSRVHIPVIGSLNAFRHEWWVERLPQIAAAGADAIELNLALLPQNFADDEAKIRRWYADTVREATSSVNIPIAVKVGPYFSSLPLLIDELHKAGAKAVVLFNRFYQFDIDIDTFKLRSGAPFSTSRDAGLPMRWISLLYGKTKMEMAASSGIHTADDLIKLILAGAQVGQLCSTLYQNGLGQVATILKGLDEYMKRHHFTELQQFRGKVSQNRSEVPRDFERIQYIKSLTSSVD